MVEGNSRTLEFLSKIMDTLKQFNEMPLKFLPLGMNAQCLCTYFILLVKSCQITDDVFVYQKSVESLVTLSV